MVFVCILNSVSKNDYVSVRLIYTMQNNSKSQLVLDYLLNHTFNIGNIYIYYFSMKI